MIFGIPFNRLDFAIFMEFVSKAILEIEVLILLFTPESFVASIAPELSLLISMHFVTFHRSISDWSCENETVSL